MITIKTQFALAKLSAIADCRGEFQGLANDLNFITLFSNVLYLSSQGFICPLRVKSILVIVIVKLQIIQKMWSSFFPKENLIHLDHTLPHYNHILFIHCMLLLAEIFLILKIPSHNTKQCFAILKKTLACRGLKASLCLAYILRNEFQLNYILQHP